MSDTNKQKVKELQFTYFSFKKIKLITIYLALFITAIFVTAFYKDGGFSKIQLNADGVVLRDHISISPSFESKLVDIYIKPGDNITAGQIIASIDSVPLMTKITQLESDKSLLQAKLSELNARKNIIHELLPISKSADQHMKDYFDRVISGKNRHFVMRSTFHQVEVDYAIAHERLLKLSGEFTEIESNITAVNSSLLKLNSLIASLNTEFNSGLFKSPITGTVGNKVASIGDSVSDATNKITNVYFGESYVIGYLPDSYIIDVRVGDQVGIMARNTLVNGYVEKILPITESIPIDFQNPHKIKERGRLSRIKSNDLNIFGVDQHVQIIACGGGECSSSFAQYLQDIMEKGYSFIANLSYKVN